MTGTRERETTVLRDWRPHTGLEPVVRIGIVLGEDAIGAVVMQAPDAEYQLLAKDAEPHTARTLRNAKINAEAKRGNSVTLAVNDEPACSAAGWRLKPKKLQGSRRGNGLLVKDVVAGRGFHWQKRVDQTLGGSIEILAARDGALIIVNELPLEAYLGGVITSEMSSRCPLEFLRAQCITARSWILASTTPKHRGQPFDCCNDDCCQRYQGTGDLSDVAMNAVESTRGLVLIAKEGGQIVDANYSKSCGGIVELPEHVWGVHKPGLGSRVDAPSASIAHKFIPVTDENLDEYLSGDWLNGADVYCSDKIVPEDSVGEYLGKVDVTCKYFRWTVRYTHDELFEILRTKLGRRAREMKQLTDLRVIQRGISGRAIQIAIAYLDDAGDQHELKVSDQYRIRQILHKSFLFSSAFAADIERSANKLTALTLRGAGWGHGAGLCQIGALGMGLCNIPYDQIVHHYFPGSDLKRLYA